MNKIPYSKILDVVAGDQIPDDLDLAPTIIARIQKRKGFRMQPKMKLVSATLLVAITLVVMFYTVPGVAATFARWFGYVPGVGLVHEGQIHVLAEPVSITREGVTVTVEQVILNQEHTTLIYSVEGIPSAASVDTQPSETFCLYKVSLLLPDGSSLLATPNGLSSLSGYRHRFDYSPLPATVSDAKLIIPCLFNTLPGAVPENWEIPLHFVPASPAMTVFPVIEIFTPTPAVTPTLIASAAEETIPEEAPITLTLDRAVQMDDGYLLYATLHWEDTPFISAEVTRPEQTLHLLDASGQEIPYEVYYDEQTFINTDQRRTVFAIKTTSIQSPGPLTLILDAVSVGLSANASFVFDPGLNPKPGQVWQPNLDVTIGDRSLHVRSITVEASGDGYSFDMTSDTGIQNASLADLEHPIVTGYNGDGGGTDRENVFFSGFYYADGLPTGPVTISIGSIWVQHIRQMQAQWTPPS